MAESRAMVGKEVAFMKKKGAPAKMVKHEMAEMKGYAKGGATVSKKEFDASEFDNLRDFLNAKRGLSRKDNSAIGYKPGRGPSQPGEDADIKGQPMSLAESAKSMNRSPVRNSAENKDVSDMTYKRGGGVKGYAKGGSIDGCAQRGKTKLKRGGSC